MTTVIKKTDSMSTIQSKLNKGGNIQFTLATYKITRQLKIPANTIIDLNGATLRRCASIQSIFLNKVTSTNTKYNAAGNITLCNGIIEGMGGYSFDNLVTFFHSHDLVISNVTFKDIMCHGLEINSSKNVKVNNCKFLGYNMKSADYTYNEMIQIDFAGFAGFVISGSSRTAPCYDATPCDNIEISNNFFSKSNYRDYPYACVGGHVQLKGNPRHTNIKIFNNEFHCKKNPQLKQACISIIGMKDVQVFNNIFDVYRVARIYTKDYSYNTAGSKVKPTNGDGRCTNVAFTDNVICGCKNNKEAFQQYNKSGNLNHELITKSKNKFVEEI